jgi:hypothetical protein
MSETIRYCDWCKQPLAWIDDAWACQAPECGWRSRGWHSEEKLLKKRPPDSDPPARSRVQQKAA